MVNVEPYDPRWPETFRAQARLLKNALGHRISAIEHIGSTAIVGLSAKPIIDIAARAAPGMDACDVEPVIRHLGYALHQTGPKNHAVFVRESDALRTEILHVFDEADWQICNQRVFRDKLMHDALARERYQILKVSLAAAGISGMEYTAAKSELIEELLNQERARRGLPPTTAWDK